MLEVAVPRKKVSSGSSLHQLLSRSSLHTRLPCCAEWLAVNAAFAEAMGLAGAPPAFPECSGIVQAVSARNADAGE